MKKYLNLFIFIFSLFSSLQTMAQNLATSEALDVRNRLESEIQKNLAQLISTRLDAQTFTVAVRLQLAPMSPPKPEDKKAPEGLPAGMDLGSIDVRELLQSYEKQIEEMKLRRDAKKDQPPQFQLKSLEVAVGLDEAYGEEYAADFTKWLKGKVKADYGNLASANVNKVKFKDKTTGKLDGAPPTPIDNLMSQLKNLAPILAALILALALYLLGRTLKAGMGVLATAQKSLLLEPKGEWSLAAPPVDEEEPEQLTEDEGNALVERLNGNEFERLTSKIAFVCLELTDRLNDLVRVWIDAGDEGFIKTALLIDTLVNAREKIMTQTGALPPLRIPIDESLMKLREENLSEAYRHVSTMAEHEKTNLLEQIYWDLVSCRTLGLQSLRRPFDFLNGMAKENVVELLKTQKDDAKALAIVYLPSEVQTQVLNDFEEGKRVELIKNMLSQAQISQKQIWDLDTSVKVATINQSAHPEEKLVNLFPRTIEVLDGLGPLDEIKILRQVAPQLPDDGLILKQQYSSLSFVDEWKPLYVKKLAQVATGDELLALIIQIPDAREGILEQCSPKIRIIIEDDLKMNTSQDDSALATKLITLRSKWNRIVTSENLPMTKVLETRKSEGALHAA